MECGRRAREIAPFLLAISLQLSANVGRSSLVVGLWSLGRTLLVVVDSDIAGAQTLSQTST